MVPPMTAVAPDVVARDGATINEQGFVVVEGLLSPSEVAACRDVLSPNRAR
jgi:hypothetical protein